MKFNDIDEIKKFGFSGFKPMKDLFVDNSVIPHSKGVYMVLNPTMKSEFVEIGTGGHFKGKNPNVPIAELESNWVSESIVVYIGKAGKSGKLTPRQLGSGKAHPQVPP